jgi:hypothetical protein
MPEEFWKNLPSIILATGVAAPATAAALLSLFTFWRVKEVKKVSDANAEAIAVVHKSVDGLNEKALEKTATQAQLKEDASVKAATLEAKQDASDDRLALSNARNTELENQLAGVKSELSLMLSKESAPASPALVKATEKISTTLVDLDEKKETK